MNQLDCTERTETGGFVGTVYFQYRIFKMFRCLADGVPRGARLENKRKQAKKYTQLHKT